jgi:hypothetical protein
MARTAWQKLSDAIAAVRRHIHAGEPQEALRALDLVEDCVAPLRDAERLQTFNTEFENHR